jgi:predicted MPP superfamily phosphohydrolase
MHSPKIGFLFSLFWLAYLPLQVYLFCQARSYLRRRFGDTRLRRTLVYLTGAFFVVILLPLAWRAFFAVFAYQPYSPLARGLFIASTVWGVGSVGCALVLIAYNVFRRVILFRSGRPLPQVAPDLQRRDFLQQSVRVAAAAPFLVSGYGVLLERRRFEVEHFDIPVSGLSSALSQLTVVHLTDIHVGPFMPPEELAEYVEAVNRLQPDLIALTGDFVTSSDVEAAPCAETLGKLKARYGVFACMGNHDVYAEADEELTRRFVERGIQALRNDSVTLQLGNTKASILGVEDLRWGRPDLAHALDVARKNPGELKILLSHRPEIFPLAARAGLDLVLSGHYHGGQVRLGRDPDALSVARFLTPYVEGLFRLPRAAQSSRKDAKVATLFVSRGVGITGLPIRINCPPQIAHLTLKNA